MDKVGEQMVVNTNGIDYFIGKLILNFSIVLTINREHFVLGNHF